MLTLLLVFGGPVFAETLLKGAIYFDSRETLSRVVAFATAKDNAGIEQLIDDGRVSRPTPIDREVVVTLTGNGPNSPAEFYFAASPVTTYWTLAKFLVAYPRGTPTETKPDNLTDAVTKEPPPATPTPVPTPTPVAEDPPSAPPAHRPLPPPGMKAAAEEPTPRAHRRHRPAPKEEEETKDGEAPAPPGLDTDGGRRIWHKDANGNWKYYLRDYPRKEVPRAEPVGSPSPPPP